MTRVYADLSTNTGTAPADGSTGDRTATDRQESEAMNDLTESPQPDTVRGRQLTANLVVSKLLQLDLPEACQWSIEADRIVVQLAVQRDAAASVTALTRWADFLGGAGIVADPEPYETPMGLLCGVNINATYRGLAVFVFDGVPVDKIPAGWLAEREAS